MIDINTTISLKAEEMSNWIIKRLQSIEKEIDETIVKFKIDKIEGEIICQEENMHITKRKSIPIRISVVDLVPSSSLFSSSFLLQRYKLNSMSN